MATAKAQYLVGLSFSHTAGTKTCSRAEGKTCTTALWPGRGKGRIDMGAEVL